MPVHVVAASESVDQALAPINWDFSALETYFTQGANADQMNMREDMLSVLGAIAGAPTIEQARFVAQSLFPVWREGGPDFPRLNRAAEPLSRPPWWDMRDNPLRLGLDDTLEINIENDGAGGAEDAWAYVIFGGGPVAPDLGKWRPFRFTAAPGALTAEDWTGSGALTADQALSPDVRYQVGGGFVWAATATVRMARLTNLLAPGSNANLASKPPIFAADSPDDEAPPLLMPGQLGVLGEFKGSLLPRLELHADAADNLTFDVLLWLRPVNGPSK